MAATSAETVTVQHEGRRYRIERTRGVLGPGTLREFWPGRGVIGSQRAWLGHRHAVRPTWYAAINPTGQPGRATARVEQLPSRRAAIRWLLATSAALGLPKERPILCAHADDGGPMHWLQPGQRCDRGARPGREATDA
jgi:hypothetical protein